VQRRFSADYPTATPLLAQAPSFDPGMLPAMSAVTPALGNVLTVTIVPLRWGLTFTHRGGFTGKLQSPLVSFKIYPPTLQAINT